MEKSASDELESPTPVISPVNVEEVETQMMDDENDLSHEGGNDDSDFMELITHINLRECEQDVSNIINGAQIRPVLRSGTTLKWKGVEWSLLTVLNDNNQKDISVFLGYDSSVGLPRSWSLPVIFTLSLLGIDDVSLAKDVTIADNVFKSNVHGREDCGRFHQWNLEDVLKRNSEHTDKDSNKNDPLLLKVRVRAEVVFSPRKVEWNYDSKMETDMVGLENLGATCYLNALLQMLYHINSFRKAVYKLPHAEEVLKTSTTLALQSVFKGLQFSKKEVSTRDLTVAFGWTSAESFMQQDVQEMMRVLIDKLEEKMANTVVDGVTKQLFAGKVRSFIKCVNVEYVSQREEDFYDIQLDVKGCRDIHDSFRKYTESEKLDGDNQYAAEGFGKQDADKGVIFTKFPPVLTIHLKRFDFNMMTMGFTKIHDHYQFPLRLELDQYLAEDSPAESRSVPNVYILHSVLVHAGDVGGGHYYAYIRPTSSGFDYSKPGAQQQHKDKQWFKFNDEQVMLVREREAVEHCYGRKEGESLSILKGGMSSAYMLVYIRESDAGEIMGEVRPEDIPSDLVTRLDTEMKERMDKLRAERRAESFNTVGYFTEDSVRRFKGYNKFQDFLTFNDAKTVRVMKQATYLNVLLSVAKDLGVNPLSIRLWSVGKRDGSAALRILESMTVADLSHKIDLLGSTYVFVEFLSSPVSAEFQEQFETICEIERKWLSKARAALSSEDYADDEEATLGLGIGSSNGVIFANQRIVRLLTLPDDLGEEIGHLTKATIDVFKKYSMDLGGDDCLIFVKAFDSCNWIRKDAEAQSSTTAEEVDEADSPLEGKEQDPVLAAMRALDGKEEPVSPTSDDLAMRAPEEYMPMKYIGYVVIKKDSLVEALHNQVSRLLAEYAGAVDERWLVTSERLHAVFYAPQNYRVLSPTRSAGGPRTMREYLLNSQMELLLTCFAKNKSTSPQEYHIMPYHINDPLKWIAYRVERREFAIKPLTDRDAQIVAKIWHSKHGHGSQHSSDSSSSSSEGDVVQGGRKRNSSDAEGVNTSAVSASTGGQHDHNDGSNTNSSATVRFATFIPLDHTLVQTITLVAERLGVDRAHLVLYMVDRSVRSTEAELMWAESVLPVCMHSPDGATLQKLVSHSKLKEKSTSQYVLFYQLSPFPLVEVKNDVIVAPKNKYFDFHISDARLRSWRRLYLEHLGVIRTDSTQNLATAIVADGTAPSGGGLSPSADLDLKRRRLSPLLAELVETSRAFSESVRSRAQFLPKSGGVSDYEGVVLDKVFVKVTSSVKFNGVSHMVRAYVGVPQNIADLLPDVEVPNARDEEAWETGAPALTLALKKSFSNGPGNVVSEDVDQGTSGATRNVAYPLAMCFVRNGIINQVISASQVAGESVTSWMDIANPLSNLWGSTVQHVSLLDMLFMTNKHPRIRSMVVSVFSFTLLGNVVQPCAVEQFGGPFLAYLREDDDHDSFCARLRAVSGDSEEDLDRCRLAVVKHRQPTFIRRPAVVQMASKLGNTRLTNAEEPALEGSGAKGTDASEDETHHAKQKDQNGDTLWHYFSAKFPEFVHTEYFALMQSIQSKEQVNWYFPLLGIQRPAAEANVNKGRRAGPKSIKIV